LKNVAIRIMDDLYYFDRGARIFVYFELSNNFS